MKEDHKDASDRECSYNADNEQYTASAVSVAQDLLPFLLPQDVYQEHVAPCKLFAPFLVIIDDGMTI